MRRRKGGFEVTYEVADGYVGGARPLHFWINEDDLEEDMTDKAISDLFYEMLEEDFRKRVSADSPDLERFTAWAKEVIANRADSE
jgi:hypothetical protein